MHSGWDEASWEGELCRVHEGGLAWKGGVGHWHWAAPLASENLVPPTGVHHPMAPMAFPIHLQPSECLT